MEVVVLVEFLVVVVYVVCDIVWFKLGDVVFVLGFGFIGLLVVKFLVV